ncbi:hypothetical protein Goe26_00180 [Bacillus phage vB_BsuM-Goe26]|nr:hypothetical protein Goe26_00180 [Bacillus phage vB_BsuM-Goe26]
MKWTILALPLLLLSVTIGNIPNKTDIEISRRWGEGMKVTEFFTGEVKRDDYPKEADYEKQKRIVSEGWQGKTEAV